MLSDFCLPFIFHKCGIYKCTCGENTKNCFCLPVLRVAVFGSWWPKRRRLYAYGLGAYYWIKHNQFFLLFLFVFQIPIKNRNTTQLMVALYGLNLAKKRDQLSEKPVSVAATGHHSCSPVTTCKNHLRNVFYVKYFCSATRSVKRAKTSEDMRK